MNRLDEAVEAALKGLPRNRSKIPTYNTVRRHEIAELLKLAAPFFATYYEEKGRSEERERLREQLRQKVETEIDYYNDLLERHPLEYDGGVTDRAAGVARMRIEARDRLVDLLASLDTDQEAGNG